MSNLIISVIASLIAVVLTYIFRQNIENIINSIFKNIYAKIDGSWEVYTYHSDEPDDLLELDKEDIIRLLEEDEDFNNDDIAEVLEEKERYDIEKSTPLSDIEIIEKLKEDNYFVKMSIKQIANKISGEIVTTYKGSEERKQIIQGKITPTRVVIINSEDKSDGHHNFGTYLLKLNSNSTILKGFETFLCTECENTASTNAIMKKVK